jgi:para-aminobenzoate synthetase component 1
VDHLENKLHIFSSGFPEKNSTLSRIRARARLKQIEERLSKKEARDWHPLERLEHSQNNLISNFSPENYLRAVRKVLDYITKGDIYQVNLSQRFSADISDGDNIELYRNLRQIFPTCFSAYLDCGDFKIFSASPERFLKLEDGKVQTRPMKGTRRRGNNSGEDRKLQKELLESIKDQAELLMIVDLERNDLGKVCSYGSVKVRNLRILEPYNTVFQTTALIEAKLHKDKDRIDLIKACFPGGSITGCPKIRAMQIIEELEPTRRGIYTGALGYLSFSGNMDLNILIRTMLLKENKVYFQVGGGIVADSDPLKEYEETLVKANALIQAINADKEQLVSIS